MKMSLAVLFDTVFDIYKKTITKQVLLNVICGVVMMFVTAIIYVAVFAVLAFSVGFKSVFSRGLSNALFNPGAVLTLVAVIVIPAIIISGLVQSVTLSGNFILSRQAYSGERVSLSETLRGVFKSLPAVISVIFAEFILFIPVFVLFLVGMFFSVALSSARNIIRTFGYSVRSVLPGLPVSSLSIASILLLVFLVIVLLIVVALVDNCVALAIPVAINEKRYFFDAIGRSFQLVKHNFFGVLGIRLLWVISIVVLNYSVVFMFNILYYVASIFQNSLVPIPGFRTMLSLLKYAFSIVLSLAISPLNGIFNSALYFSQSGGGGVKNEQLQ